MLRLVAALVLVLAGPALSDPPPAKPGPEHDPVALAEGEIWAAPAGGGVCLDLPAATYVAEARRRAEAEAVAALEVAEGARLKGAGWGAAAGVVVGIVAGIYLAGRVSR